MRTGDGSTWYIHVHVRTCMHGVMCVCVCVVCGVWCDVGWAVPDGGQREGQDFKPLGTAARAELGRGVLSLYSQSAK